MYAQIHYAPENPREWHIYIIETWTRKGVGYSMKILTSTSMPSHFFDAGAVYGVALAMKTLRRTIVFRVAASMVGSADTTSIASCTPVVFTGGTIVNRTSS